MCHVWTSRLCLSTFKQRGNYLLKRNRLGTYTAKCAQYYMQYIIYMYVKYCRNTIQYSTLLCSLRIDLVANPLGCSCSLRTLHSVVQKKAHNQLNRIGSKFRTWPMNNLLTFFMGEPRVAESLLWHHDYRCQEAVSRYHQKCTGPFPLVHNLVTTWWWYQRGWWWWRRRRRRRRWWWWWVRWR